ncbi:hypothetical protein LPJ70_000058 [Coemansia sp. RSA 2708]|nr:hypothetical protein LPJ70_000058 [Coemansia sp. RSA 2708]KAJ2315768.1 hypothetical protein IWW54_000009 [Coemansia sp. RSA 2705]KAJ2322475.1 hypothetical protein IWW52_000010 [Coemansia sp. RSA 2704]KAJ2370590.1 hypothetical protein H4S01_000254 [Coemansia sp. RSA 2610]
MLGTQRAVHLEPRKSIYDTDPPPPAYPQPLSTTTTRLAQATGTLRTQTVRVLCGLRAHGQLAVDSWIALERRVAGIVGATVAPGERLLPAAVYVGVAALAGPIFMRRRAWPVRWASPVVFAGLAAAVVLPGTAMTVVRNVWARYGDPAAIDRAQDAVSAARRSQREAREAAVAWVERLRMALQEGRPVEKAERIIEQTAEKADETFEKAEQTVKTAEQTVEKPDLQLPVGFSSK